MDSIVVLTPCGSLERQNMTSATISRRMVFSGLGAAAIVIGLGNPQVANSHVGTPVAGESHPLVGTWIGIIPDGTVPMIFGADGSFTAVHTVNTIDLEPGVFPQGPALGHWAVIGDSSAHFTGVQVLVDGDGMFVGTWTFEGHPQVSADRQSYVDDAARRLTFRDATNTIVFDEVLSPSPPIVATRVEASPDSLVFSSSPPIATPLPPADSAGNGQECFFCL